MRGRQILKLRCEELRCWNCENEPIAVLWLFQSLPPPLRLLEAVLSELKSWRRKFTNFPVVSSSDFARFVRLRVNPLSTGFHLQRLTFQLQVIGEVGSLFTLKMLFAFNEIFL